MFILSAIIAAVCLLIFLWQLLSGTAIAGQDQLIHRKERPAQYWFLIVIESLALLVGFLAFAVFQLGIQL